MKARARRKSVPVVDARLRSDQILWRYLDLPKLLDFLMYRRLYFARGDQFGDKFEGGFTKSLRQSIRESYDENAIDFSYEQFKERLRSGVYVNCWHRGSHDSMAMWTIYGGGRPSIVITTTVGQLKKALIDAKLPHFISIRRVSYISHWNDPEIDVTPYSNVFSYKVRAYAYENEVRAIIDRFHEAFDSDEMDTGMYVAVSRSQLLRSIVVSPEAPAWFRRIIWEIVRDYDLEVDIRRSRLDTRPI